jgi:hypothetical protein
MSSDEIRGKIFDLLRKLEEAKRTYEPGNFVEFCVDCGRIVTMESVDPHTGHTTVFTDYDHDGIGEWERALKWVLKLMKTYGDG